MQALGSFTQTTNWPTSPLNHVSSPDPEAPGVPTIPTRDVYEPGDELEEEEPESSGDLAQSNGPGVSPKEFEQTARREGWSGAYGQNFEDAMRYVSQDRPDVFRDDTDGTFTVVGNNNLKGFAGQTSIPRSPRGRAHMEVATQDVDSDGNATHRSPLSIGKDIVHEHAHAKYFKDLGVTRGEFGYGKQRNALGQLSLHIEESLAYRQGNEFYIRNGGNPDDIERLRKNQKRETTEVDLLESARQHDRPSEADYQKLGLRGYKREAIDEEFRSLKKQYESLTPAEKKRLEQFLQYYHPQIQGGFHPMATVAS